MDTTDRLEQLDNVVLSPDKNSVVIIDQTLLPNRLEYLTLSKAEDLYDAIVMLRVRGAPAIGIFAGFASYVLGRQIKTQNYEEFSGMFFKNTAYLNSARPTAVNLEWALRRMDGVVRDNPHKTVPEILQLLERESLAIRKEDIAMCTAISENGLKVLKDGDSILTHCNTGPLATSRYGTAIGPVLLGHERGLNFKVFADETRPLLQGARLTAFELYKAGVDVTLICDNMASLVNTAYLNSARPTAVNLEWALRRMDGVVRDNPHKTVPEILQLLERESLAIRKEDIAMCTAISENGLKVLKDGDSILTHCNTGPLATSRYGTAIGPVLLGHERGLNFKVFADETRPLLQGARLTAFELYKAGVDVTLICDNMASLVMKNGWVQACLVGCDRVAANGDTANKIGTSGVAILARHYNIPFYVLGPTSTIDLECPTGEDIEIELRAPEEIKEKFYTQPKALPEVKCYNPAFDVTDHSLITAIITEKGICYPPYSDSLRLLFD